jgi:hypothetical protein
MLEYELKYLRKIRIWFKPNKEYLLEDKNIDKKNFSSFNSDGVVNTTVIVELFIPRGGRNIYGLLGVDYIATSLNNIEVSISNGKTVRPQILHDPLVGKSEPVYLYLPEEFRNSIFQQMKSLSDNHELKINGKLKFYYGAVSEISSSDWIFRKLTNLVVKLLGISEKDISCDLLDSLLEE